MPGLTSIASGSNPVDKQSFEEGACVDKNLRRVINPINIIKQVDPFSFSYWMTRSWNKRANRLKQEEEEEEEEEMEEEPDNGLRLHPESPQIQRPQRSMKQIPPTISLLEDDEFFGLEKDEIKHLLIRRDDPSPSHPRAPVIAIWGQWGLGKTSLLKNMYNDFEIRRHFQCFAWVYMPGDFETRNIMQCILLQLVPNMRKKILEKSFLELTEQLYRLQKEKKCLIVLSDVRKRENWRMLSVAFPPANKTRSQILLTTREREFADDIGDRALEISPLDEKQSWKLFQRIIDITFDKETEKKLKEIVLRRCKGSPLAISILAGYLNSADISSSDDEIASLVDELGSHLNEELIEVKDTVHSIIDLSYRKLSDKLKECFLYLAHLPSEGELHMDDIYVRWIYEGLISKTRQNPMEVAEHYLEQLSQRNLVQMLEQVQGPSIGSYLSCKLHPLVREFCKIEAEKINGNELMSVMVPRLPLNSKAYQIELPSKQGNHRLRSLTFAGTFEPPPEIVTSKQLLVDFTEFDWLRVLEFYGVDFRGWDLPEEIGGLMRLKYLSLQRCYLVNLPPSIGDLWRLRTLDLRVEPHCRMWIPNVLWKLTKLERLYFPLRYQCGDDGTLSLKNLEKIQVLVNFNTGVCDIKDLEAMKKLVETGAVVEESHSDLKKILDTDLLIGYLSLDVRNFNCYSASKRNVLEKLMGCERLRSLHFEGYIKKLPEKVTSVSPNLTEIVLSGAELKQDPMPRFGKIPNLRSLTLCNDAYVGNHMDCRGFLDLRSLKLKSLRKLKTWEVEEGAMGKLLSLSIEKCVKLTMLPPGLKFVAGLRELMIVSMPEKFEQRVQVVEGKEGEDVCKINHVPRIIISSM